MAVGNVIARAFVEILPDFRRFAAGARRGTRTAVGGLAAGMTALNRQSDQMAHSFDRANRFTRTMGLTMASTALRGTRLFGSLTAIATGLVIKGGIERLMGLEEGEQAMIAVGIAAKDARQVIEDVNKAVIGTAFSFDEGARAVASLAATGVDLKILDQTFKNIADAAAFSDQPLNEIAEIFIRVQTQSKLTGRELLRLGQRGIPAVQLLADAAGVTGSEFREMVTEGEITSDKFFKLWTKGAKSFDDGNLRMAGAAKELAKTTKGALTNTGIAIQRLSANFFSASFKRIKPALLSFIQNENDLTKSVTKAGEAFDRWLTRVGDFARKVKSVVTPPIKALVGWIKDNKEAIGEFLDAFIPAVGVALSFAGAIKVLGRAWEFLTTMTPVKILTGIVTALVFAYQKSETFRQAVKRLFAAVENILDSVQKFADKIGEALGPAIDEIWRLIKNDLIPVFGELLRAALPVFETIAKVAASVLGGGIVAAVAIILPALSFFSEALTGLIRLFNLIPDDIQGIIIALGLLAVTARPIFRVLTTALWGVRGSFGRLKDAGGFLGWLGKGGPWGIAIAAGATVLGFFAEQIFGAKEHVEDFTEAIKADGGAIRETSKAALAAAIADAGLAEMAKAAGVELSVVTGHILGETQAINTLNNKKEVLRKKLVALAQITAGEMTPAQRELEQRYLAQSGKLNDLIRETEKLGGQMGEAKTEAKNYTDAMNALKEADRRAAEATRRQKNALKATLTQIGLNKADVRLYSRLLKNVPDNVRTKVLADLSAAEKKFDAFVKKYQGPAGLVKFDADLKSSLAKLNIGSGVFATGGAVHGPGTGTSDSIIARLSNDEHVWTAREVAAAGGHKAVEQLRAAVLGFARGGRVGPAKARATASTATAEADLKKMFFDKIVKGFFGFGGGAAGAWARSQAGKPYIWGGVGPTGYDCSGFMSAIANIIRGRPPHSRLGSTATFPWPGFVPGPGYFTIGSTRAGGIGGSAFGHMAGTLGGMNVESRGGDGVVVGSGARGAFDSLFRVRAHLQKLARGGRVKDGDPPYDLLKHIKPRDFYQTLGMMHNGGVVPKTGRYLLKRGEEVSRSSNGGGEVHNHFDLRGAIIASERDAEDWLTKALQRMNDRGRLKFV